MERNYVIVCNEHLTARCSSATSPHWRERAAERNLKTE